MRHASSNHHVQLLGTATVGPKGQVVIPAEARDRMGIKPGDKIVTLYLPQKKAVGFICQSDAQEMIDQMGARLDDLRAVIGNSRA